MPGTRLLTAINAARLSLAMATVELLLKANFNPNQPRVPSGNPDGGQWAWGSGGGANTPASRTSGPPGSSFRSPSIGGSHRLIDRGTHVQLGDDGPAIPKQPPQSIRQANRIGVGAAQWLLRTAVRASPIGRVADLVSAAGWLYAHRHDIEAYLQGPKSLDELRIAARAPRRGYETHHLVEQTPARQDGFPETMIRASENLVLIPRYRHWEITGWYMTRTDRFGDLSARDYLRGRSWEERIQVGVDVLGEMGIIER